MAAGFSRPPVSVRIAILALVLAPAVPRGLSADGFLAKKARYRGSIEESSQEAIIILRSSRFQGQAREDLILKINAEGEPQEFAWVIPFPNEPTVEEADSVLFEELFNYTKAQMRRTKKFAAEVMMGAEAPAANVEVLSREEVGSYDVAVVRENTPGKLNEWLTDEGYQPIEDGEDVIGFYREKGYVFACIKISDARLNASAPTELHPLRFSFKTGGSDGVYFPMKMTGLQTRPFDVNLYVFHRWWLNDSLNRYGYEERGFECKYRDFDSPRCKPNAGKNWSDPIHDPFLRPAEDRIGTVSRLFQELHPDEHFYMTNIQAHNLEPAEVRRWKDDLWLFPYYRDERMVPYDAREDGPAYGGYSG